MMGSSTHLGEAEMKEKSMLRFQVDGMSCGHCVQAVTAAVKDVDPQAEVAVDLASKSVAVRSRLEAGPVAEAIRQAGYEVRAA
jgi:copper chaperone